MDLQSPTAVERAVAKGSASAVAVAAERIGRYRWVICALLLFGITKNNMDRQVLGVLKATLQQQFGWNEIDYSNIVAYFQGAYAVGLMVTGWLIDRVGSRLGYAIAMVAWSLASMAHAAAASVGGFALVRTALGLSESAVLPASIKCVAEWFPKKQRAFASGIFNAGSSVGAMIT